MWILDYEVGLSSSFRFVLLPLTVVGSIGISAYVQWINFGVYLRCCAAYGNECMLRLCLVPI